MKICTKCKESKPLDQFHNKKSAKDGKQSSCKECNIKTVQTWQSDNSEEYEKYWRANNTGSSYNLKRRARTYGLSVDELNKMLEAANGLCEICKREPHQWLVVDHCHNSLKVRGILCEKCNQGLGCFQDNIEFMKSAIQYLEKA